MIIVFKRILKVYNHTVNIYGQNQCWQCSCPDTLTLIRPLRLQRCQSTTNILMLWVVVVVSVSFKRTPDCLVMVTCIPRNFLEHFIKSIDYFTNQHHTFCYTLETPWKMYMRINWNTQLLLTSTSTKDWWVNHWRIFNFSNYS